MPQEKPKIQIQKISWSKSKFLSSIRQDRLEDNKRLSLKYNLDVSKGDIAAGNPLSDEQKDEVKRGVRSNIVWEPIERANQYEPFVQATRHSFGAKADESLKPTGLALREAKPGIALSAGLRDLKPSDKHRVVMRLSEGDEESVRNQDEENEEVGTSSPTQRSNREINESVITRVQHCEEEQLVVEKFKPPHQEADFPFDRRITRTTQADSEATRLTKLETETHGPRESFTLRYMQSMGLSGSTLSVLRDRNRIESIPFALSGPGLDVDNQQRKASVMSAMPPRQRAKLNALVADTLNKPEAQPDKETFGPRMGQPIPPRLRPSNVLAFKVPQN